MDCFSFYEVLIQVAISCLLVVLKGQNNDSSLKLKWYLPNIVVFSRCRLNWVKIRGRCYNGMMNTTLFGEFKLFIFACSCLRGNGTMLKFFGWTILGGILVFRRDILFHYWFGKFFFEDSLSRYIWFMCIFRGLRIAIIVCWSRLCQKLLIMNRLAIIVGTCIQRRLGTNFMRNGQLLFDWVKVLTLCGEYLLKVLERLH